MSDRNGGLSGLSGVRFNSVVCDFGLRTDMDDVGGLCFVAETPLLPLALGISPTTTFGGDNRAVCVRSNIEIRDPVGGMLAASTGASSCVAAAFSLPIAPMLPTLLGVWILGFGLALRLAANVAAMRLGFFASSFPASIGERAIAICAAGFVLFVVVDEVETDDGEPNCCSRAAIRPA